MMKPAIVTLSAIAGYSLWRAYTLWRDDGELSISTLTEDFTSTVQTMTNTATSGAGFEGIFTPIDPNTGRNYSDLINKAARENYVPPLILAALLWQESRFRANATGPNTAYGRAKGIAQFVDTTAVEWKLTNPYDPDQAIPVAARYLRWLWGQAGTWRKAVAAYNWGIGNVRRKGLSAMPTETINYVASVYDRFASKLPA